MTEPINFAAAKWNKGDGDPNNHRPRDALDRAIAAIESGEHKPAHVIVIFGEVVDRMAKTTFYQSGSFDEFAQGLMNNAIALHYGSE